MRVAILSANPKLCSTKRLVKAAQERGHDALVIDHMKCQVIIENDRPAILYNKQLIDSVDAIIPRIGASVTDYGCIVVRQFEIMRIFTTAKSQTISRAHNKLRSLQILSKASVGLPRTVMANHPKDVEQLIDLVGSPPVVIKLLEGTQGIGVVLAETAKAAKATIEAFTGLKQSVLVQKYIAESKGTDVRAFVSENQAVGITRQQGPEGEFRSNLHRGGSAIAIELTREIEATALGATKTLELKVAGVDMLLSNRGPLVMEVNSSPGLEGIEKATGRNIAADIIAFVEEKIRADENDVVGV